MFANYFNLEIIAEDYLLNEILQSRYLAIFKTNIVARIVWIASFFS